MSSFLAVGADVLPAPGSEGRATWAAGGHNPRPRHPRSPPRVAGRQSARAGALGPPWPARASELALMLGTPRPPPALLAALGPVRGFPPGAGPGDPRERCLLGPLGRGGPANSPRPRCRGAPRCGPSPAQGVPAGPVTGPSGHANSSGRWLDVAFHDKPRAPAQRGFPLVGPADLAHATNSLCGLLPRGSPGPSCSRPCPHGRGLPRSWLCIWGTHRFLPWGRRGDAGV